jgi:hypothetical protein
MVRVAGGRVEIRIRRPNERERERGQRGFKKRSHRCKAAGIIFLRTGREVVFFYICTCLDALVQNLFHSSYAWVFARFFAPAAPAAVNLHFLSQPDAQFASIID